MPYLCSMRIFIIGYMGSGKTTFGPKLAGVMGLEFYDLDVEFEARYKISISDFFLKYGEVFFREIEHNLLAEFAQKNDLVLACGGGTPCHHDNLSLMKEKGITVYLEVPAEVLIKRLKDSPRKRPILKTFTQSAYEQHIREHLAIRETSYRQAHIILDGRSPDPEKAALQIRQKALSLTGE